MLVTIQLPDELMIAGALGVEIRDSAEIAETGLDSGAIVAPPTNLRAGFHHSAEYWKSMRADRRSRRNYLERELGACKRSCNHARIGQRQSVQGGQFEMNSRRPHP